MAFHTTTLLIDAPPQAVWQILSDLESWPSWTPTVSRVERLDSGPIGIGSRVRVFQPKLRPAVWVVTQWEPGAAFTWVSSSFGSRIVAEHILAPEGDGCRLTLSLRFQGVVGTVVGMAVSRLTDTYLLLEAEGLKQRAEASTEIDR